MTPDELATAAVERVLEDVLGELRHRSVCSVEEAGRVLGLGRSQAYDAARQGVIPTIRLGRSSRVPIPALAGLLVSVPQHSGDRPASNAGRA